MLRLLNDEELEGALGHELAHVKRRDILISSVAATLAAAIMMTSRFAMFWGAAGRNDDREGGAGNPLVLLATIILAPVAALLIQMVISRSREFDADAGGAAIAGSPGGLVSALRKLEAASHAVPLDAKLGHGTHVHRQADVGLRVVVMSARTVDRRSRRGVARPGPAMTFERACSLRTVAE